MELYIKTEACRQPTSCKFIIVEDRWIIHLIYIRGIKGENEFQVMKNEPTVASIQSLSFQKFTKMIH